MHKRLIWIHLMTSDRFRDFSGNPSTNSNSYRTQIIKYLRYLCSNGSNSDVRGRIVECSCEVNIQHRKEMEKRNVYI
jgi:hypothetical protein